MHSANKPSFDNKDYFHILKKKNYDINVMGTFYRIPTI